MSKSWKNIVRWFVGLFGREVIEETVEFVEEKTGWEIPEESIIEFANRFLPDILGIPDAKLWDGQGDVLEKLDRGDTLVDGDRNSGKTLLLTIHAAYKMFREPNTTVVVKGIDYQNSQHVLNKVLVVIEAVRSTFNVDILNKLPSSIELSNGSKVRIGETDDLVDLRGSTINLFLADEIAFWSDEAVKGLVKNVPHFNSVLNLASTDWDDKLAGIIKLLPKAIDFVKLVTGKGENEEAETLDVQPPTDEEVKAKARLNYIHHQ